MPVNGQPHESIATSDRGLAYGDGLFETILIHQGTPILLAAHLDRLEEGARRLKIPLDRGQLEAEIAELSANFPEQGVLKLMVTRGSGGRGYAPPDSPEPVHILGLHDLPAYPDNLFSSGIDVFVCQQRLARQPALAGIKHLNRLEQVLASMEWPNDTYMEGLMLDTEGHVIEGTRSNIFWVQDGELMTPSLSQCGVAGIMRNYLASCLGQVREVNDCSLAQLCEASEVFFCNSIFGVWPVRKIQSGDTEVTFPADQRHFSHVANKAVSELLASVST